MVVEKSKKRNQIQVALVQEIHFVSQTILVTF